MFRKIYFIVFLLGSILWQVEGQDLGLQMMNNVWQSNKTNPAMITDQKVIYSFPSFSAAFGSTAFAYNDLITVNAQGENVIKADDLIDQLSNDNGVWASLDIETFNVSFGGKLWRVFASHSIRSNMMATFPKTLAQITLQGNAQFIGQEVNIAPNFQGQSYSEIGIGAAIKLTKLTVGGRIKILNGIGDVSAAKRKASIHTADNSVYELTLSSDYQINSAGLADINGLDDVDVDTEFDVLDVTPKDLILGSNLGFGIDLGATLQVTEKLKVAASIVDLGYIKWTKNVKNYSSQGTYVFKGLDLLDVIEDDSTAFEAITDTLADIFNFTKTENSYTTVTPARIFISGSYQVSKLFRVGALVSTRPYRGELNPAIAVSAAVDLGNIFSFGTVISQSSYAKTALGLNGSLKLGPVQIFALTDNILAAFNPWENQFTHARLGMNLAFK